MAEFRAVSESIKSVVPELTEEIRLAFIEQVKSDVARIVERDRPSGSREWVDGIEGKPLESVNMPGNVRFTFSYIEEVVRFAVDVLRQFSPVESGRYKSSHVVEQNGVEHTDLSRLSEDDVYLYNTVPYAGRLERASKWWHKSSGRKGQPRSWANPDRNAQNPQPPEAIYKTAASVIRAKYARNLYQVRYIQVSGPNGNTPALLIRNLRG